MIDVRISRSGLERFNSNGTPAEIVLEFGYLINQYCTAIKKCCPQALPGVQKAFADLTEPGSPIWKLDEGVEGFFVSRRVDE